jgi:hypothetical protein
MTDRWPYRTMLVALISVAVSLAPVALASFLASFGPAAAQSPAPGNGTHSPPFTTTLSNMTPLVVGMNIDDATQALGTQLSYVSGRPGDEVFLAHRNVGGSGLFDHNDRLYLQFRQGRLGRLEGRLGPQLDVAIASRHICNPQQMDQPWDKISS